VLNAVVIGLMVLSVAGLELGNALQRWEEWIELTFGLWLAASPWLLGYNHLTAVTALHVALGAVVAVLACFELWQDRGGIPPVRRIG
jgi:heme/copper-type cytochrome/quinol oxidase subunit 3